MNITSSQVAQKLGVSVGTARKLGESGEIIRIKTGNGVKKIHYLYDSKSVNEFKKIYDKNRRSRASTERMKAEAKRNGSIVTILPAKMPTASMASGIFTRMGNLEDTVEKMQTEMADMAEKINHLIRIWS